MNYLKEGSIKEKLSQGFRANGKLVAFLVCLLIAIVCWVFTSLNKSYSGKFVFKLEYKNLPFQKNITNKLPPAITVELEARGFDLIAYSFRQKLEKVEVDVASLVNSNNLNRNSLVVASRNILTSEITGNQPGMLVKHVVPELITFDFSPRYRKKVPVKPAITVGYKKQFYAPFKWIVKPDSIEIAGSKEDLDKTNEIATSDLRLEQLDHKTILSVDLRTDKKGIEINPSKVWVYLPVEELAEEEVLVNVELVNENGMRSFLLPDKVTIVYQAPLRLIDQVNAEEFRVCADLQSKIATGSKQTRLLICHTPPGVYKARIEPSTVQYLTAK